MNPETILTRKIKKHIKETHPDAYIIKLSDRFTSGIPDLYVAFNGGKSMWLEVKTSTGKIDPMQEHTIAQLNKRGIVSARVHSVKDVEKQLQKIFTVVK